MANLIIVILLTAIVLIIAFGLAMYFVITSLHRQLRKKEAESIESIITAQERERATISREVHDNLGPMLSITQMQIGYLLEQAEDPERKEMLAKMKTQVLEAIHQCRSIAHMISSEVNSSKSFQAVLKEQIAFINEYGNVQVNLVVPKDLPSMDPMKGTSLIRVFQELFVNTIRHSEASEVNIAIEITPDHLYMNYQDNGKGFELKKVTLGLGIQNISKRIEIIGGKQLWNEPLPLSGMRLQILIPFQKILHESSHR